VDNGSAPAAAVTGGFGVAGMRERAVLFGGELVAERRDDGGFCVAARLPLAAP
jgi:signal transduction histidine kinase